MQARDAGGRINSHDPAHSCPNINEGNMDVIKGPWTREEDAKLIDYINLHGEGRWSSLASLAGLKRTGKSCRLRWLNYLRPNIRRGNLTVEEQLLILELHCRYGNRWSQIAQHLPGRTDNEIKNYWRTKVQKLARRLNCDVKSENFRYTLRSLWLPRFVEQIRAASSRGQVQSNNIYDNNNSYWTGPNVAAGENGLGPTFINSDSPQLQPYCNVPPDWKHFGDNNCNLEDSPLCPSEPLCSPFFSSTDFVELDNEAFAHTEPSFGSPYIFSATENFWHS